VFKVKELSPSAYDEAGNPLYSPEAIAQHLQKLGCAATKEDIEDRMYKPENAQYLKRPVNWNN
jgi:hypothetical protein